MPAVVPRCRIVAVHAFRGDRGQIAQMVRKKLDDQKYGVGRGPTRIECLLYAGHTGVSTDGSGAIYGFNPSFGRMPLWRALDRLRNGDAFPGVVSNDTRVFRAAKQHGLAVVSFEIVLPAPSFQTFAARLAAHRKKSRYTYGFPNGDGDCNCTTWLERLGLPLLTGRMDEFSDLIGFNRYPRRKFGECN